MEEEKVPQRVERISVPALDAILGVSYPVLDKGFIRVVDYMGGDASIVQAARTSYGKGTKKISEDEGLIRYLLRHSHTTPFEMCQLKIHVKVPMDCWRQWIRHRMSSTNEYSTRYSEAIDDKQQTKPADWRGQSVTNKQGSSGFVDAFPDGFFIPGNIKDSQTPGEYLSMRESEIQARSAEIYHERLKFGVAKEVARKDLPLSTYTEAYWCIDLHNLLHFLSLRMDKHAQQEIRSYATTLGEIVSLWCPLSWSAFNDYNFRRHALLLSRRDKAMINCMNQTMQGHSSAAAEYFSNAKEWGWLEYNDAGELKANRERQEFEDKVSKLGFVVQNWPAKKH